MRVSRSAPPFLLLAALAVLLGGCGAPTPSGPSDSSATPSPAPTPSSTPGGGPEDDDEPDPVLPPSDGGSGADPDDGTLSAAERAAIRGAIAGGDASSIEPYLADPVWLIYAATECCGQLAPADAIAGFDYRESAVPPWGDIPPADLAAYRASFYAEWFPDDLIAVRSSDGFVISLGIERGRIASIFMTWDDVIRMS